MPRSNRINAAIKNIVTASMADNVLELCFYDTIQNPEYFDWNTMQVEEGNLVADIISQVKAYNPSKIRMEIDCMGGDLGKAIAIYNFLKDFPARIECKIVAFCASAATVISCAASPGKRTMAVNGFYITHESSIGDVSGTSKELREAADVNDRYTQTMAEILAANNSKGRTADEIMALWKNGDCWMTGKEAEEYGFVDSCYNETAIVTARIDEAKERFKNAPAKITATADETTNTSILTKIENSMKSFSEMVTAALDKFKGAKVTAKVDGVTNPIDITEAVTASIQPVLADLAANMQTEVTAEVGRIKDEVTAAFEEKYGAVITSLQTENGNLKKSITDLQSDITAKVGGESSGGNPSASAESKKTFGRGVGGSKS